MARVQEMLIPLAVLLIAMNVVVVAMTNLPNSSSGTTTYDFGLSNSALTDLNSSYVNLDSDLRGLSQDVNGLVASDSEKTSLDLLGSILYAAGKTVQIADGIISGGISLIVLLIKYVLLLIFGYFFYIDYFFTPLIAVGGSIGNFFTIFPYALKGILFLIQIFGLIEIFLPTFSAGRNT